MDSKQLHLVWKCFLLSNIDLQLAGLIDRPYNGKGNGSKHLPK